LQPCTKSSKCCSIVRALVLTLDRLHLQGIQSTNSTPCYTSTEVSKHQECELALRGRSYLRHDSGLQKSVGSPDAFCWRVRIGCTEANAPVQRLDQAGVTGVCSTDLYECRHTPHDPAAPALLSFLTSFAEPPCTVQLVSVTIHNKHWRGTCRIV